ncbi:U7 snRNA-associated Sm-like protein LSm11 [Drosophila busckii]|uniref:U7 snRNA-associated Sm-like protein LSm11 n=1 Tax=Drosophila busckii TaxID=30019 RepID=UPI0014333FDD|nr:U7 snRNA-associated Sm-like protein LSm11 [Drosophila busckii]
MSEVEANQNDEAEDDQELDVGSTHFNPLRALYATDYKITEKKPKVLYQNIAAFESAFAKVGIWGLNKRQKDKNSTEAKSDQVEMVLDPMNVRRFEPHQMAIKGTIKKKHQRNIFTHMASTEGPLALLQKCLPDSEVRPRVRVYQRNERGIRGSLEGDLVAFDKQWNLLLKNVIETWQRRKYKYSEQKICDPAVEADCHARLRALGITLPTVKVKSLNRKNVQLTREIPSVMIRGEHVVLIKA